MSDLEKYILNLPKSPGVYQFYDKLDIILYIGKAKNLKSRVSSYFVKSNNTFKNSILTKQIHSIKHIIVDSEEDALLLENNLIKQFQPKYNVLLKDDKTFPWICIKNEDFPRVLITRNKINDGSVYFGPYTSVLMIRTLLDMIKQIYPLRTCKHSLSDENIHKEKFSRCLEFHLGNCLGPCEGLHTEDDYNNNIQNIKHILKGNINEVIQFIKDLMHEFAGKLQFEEAEKAKLKIEMLERYKSKSTVVNPSITNVDVFGFVEEGKTVFVSYLKVINGAIVQSYSLEVVRKIDEEIEDILSFALINIRDNVNSNSKLVLLPIEINTEFTFEIKVPQRGDNKKLLDLAMRNANNYRVQKKKVKEEIVKKKGQNIVLNTLKIDLRLKELPDHIECFDNSNIQGTNPVAACVVFRNGKPAKSEYRHFHIKTVIGANDFASMEEIIYRRYKRLLDEKRELPQLIVIDGGKGQLSSALKSLKELELYDKIAIIGIAKKLEEINFPGDSVPLYIDKNSPSLKLIQHLRNEAHRFGITFHRQMREKKLIYSELETIQGIGRINAEKLLVKFGSIDNIKLASEEELAEVIGKKATKNVIEYFSH